MKGPGATPRWDLLERLVTVPAPPGWEERVAAQIAEDAGSLAPVRRDALGNLAARVGSGPPHVIFCAHMDEVGLLATAVEADGAVRFRPLGGVDDAALVGRHVRLLTSGGEVPGVIGIAPPHLREGPGAAAGWRTLAIDVGARSPAEAESLGVRPPQPVSFAKIWIAGDEALVGKGLDDRLGCWLLLELLAAASPRRGTLTMLWTVQDEIGLRGAAAAAAAQPCDVLIQWDVLADHRGRGRGPVLRTRDDGSASSPDLLRWATECARRAGIDVAEVTARGESEARAFQERGARTLSVNVPVAYLHTEVETVARRDVEALHRLGHALMDGLEALGV